MSHDDNKSQKTSSSPSPNRRRSSFTTNKLSEMFSSARNPQSGSPPNSPPTQSSPNFNNPFGPGAQAANTSNGRRMSISTVGLGAAGNGLGSAGPMSAGPSSAPGPANLWGFRRGSVSTGPPSNASDESAIDDSADATFNGNAVSANGPAIGARRGSGSAGAVPPGSPFGRRMSFGARAMGQMRGENQGFNWADNLRTRQSRSSSAAGGGLMSPHRGSMQSESMAQPPSQPPAPKEPAQLPKREPMNKPDHFQERILKGDFYMD